MRPSSIGLALALSVLSGALLLGCATGGAPASPTQVPDVPLAAKTVWAGSYNRDIQAIFGESCVSCHGPAVAENGLRLDSYAAVMKGTASGEVVIPGSPSTSTLMTVILGTADPQIQMPHNSRRLTPNRLENIRLWIQAGAPND
jgi:mono/diheme cytochrome c family protein